MGLGVTHLEGCIVRFQIVAGLTVCIYLIGQIIAQCTNDNTVEDAKGYCGFYHIIDLISVNERISAFFQRILSIRQSLDVDFLIGRYPTDLIVCGVKLSCVLYLHFTEIGVGVRCYNRDGCACDLILAGDVILADADDRCCIQRGNDCAAVRYCDFCIAFGSNLAVLNRKGELADHRIPIRCGGFFQGIVAVRELD